MWLCSDVELELRQNVDAAEARIDAVRDRDVHDAVFAASGTAGLRGPW